MSDALPLPPSPDIEQYRKLANDLKFACDSSEPGAVRDWALRVAGSESEGIERLWQKVTISDGAARCTLSGAQLFVARVHGFASWPKFAAHVNELGRADSAVSQFEAAADAIVAGDLRMLQEMLGRNPELVRVRSLRENHATLLHYVAANGVEDFRQKTPKNIVEIAKAMLRAGADVNAESDAYGGGYTTLGLVATSIHPERAGVQIELLQTLLGAGAWIDKPGTFGSVVDACLANGQPDAAEFLARRGVGTDRFGGGLL